MLGRVEFQQIINKSKSRSGRIIVLTGARQTGKTTIAKQCFPEYQYFAIDNLMQSIELKKLSAAQWASNYPKAILDEIQLEPLLINSIKATYDQFHNTKYLLLGSSQLLLLQKVKESLAGRCIIREIYPLLLTELRAANPQNEVENSFFIDYILKRKAVHSILPSFVLDRQFVQKKQVFDYYLSFGGYPALTNGELDDNERYEWLENYVRTFLERDIRDLASFRDLEPFVKLQLYLSNTTASVTNYSSIAKETGVTVPTVQRYIQYMAISYQTIILQAWHSNALKKLVKSPKIHILDPGVMRAILKKRGVLNGSEFESAIVSEIYKQIKTYHLPYSCYHLRTQDGREVDLLLEGEDHFIAIEIKSSHHIDKNDCKAFLGLEEIVNKPLRHCFLLSNDNETKNFGQNITALHAAAFLG